jgi:hypothetical protein
LFAVGGTGAAFAIWGSVAATAAQATVFASERRLNNTDSIFASVMTSLLLSKKNQ